MNKMFDEFRETFFEETEEHLMIFNDNLISLEKSEKKKIHIDIFQINILNSQLHPFSKLAYIHKVLQNNTKI